MPAMGTMVTLPSPPFALPRDDPLITLAAM
jgi:hypothetical protein